jgi:hypothetical protein
MLEGTKPSLFALPLESVATQGVGVGNAHIAPLIGAGSGVPFPRASALTGIDLTRNVIGRRTRARGVDEITARRSRGTGRATVGATGIFSRRGIRLRRAVGWGSAVGWSRSAILCVRLHHPGGRSQNTRGYDSDQNAFHRYLPWFCKGATESNVRVKANVPTIKLALDRRQHRKGFGRFRSQLAQREPLAVAQLASMPLEQSGTSTSRAYRKITRSG